MHAHGTEVAKMKKLIALYFFGLALASPAMSGDVAGHRDGVFIHITHGTDDPHRLLMALKMATLMAEGQKDVLVYFDIDAVKVLAADAPDISHPTFPSAHEQLHHLGEAGVRVRACPACLKAAGIDPKDLLKGVAIANGEEFFSFTRGRILTLDY